MYQYIIKPQESPPIGQSQHVLKPQPQGSPPKDQPQHVIHEVPVVIEHNLLGSVKHTIKVVIVSDQISNESLSDTAALDKQVLEQIENHKKTVTSQFNSYWYRLRKEIKNILVDPHEMAGIFLEIALELTVTSIGAISVQIINYVRKRKRRQYSTGRHGLGNPLIEEMDKAIGQIIDFFMNVPKSRIAEISHATGIQKDRLRSILKALQFQHEKACFWQPAKLPIKLSRWQKAKINIKRILRFKKPVRLGLAKKRDETIPIRHATNLSLVAKNQVTKKLKSIRRPRLISVIGLAIFVFAIEMGVAVSPYGTLSYIKRVNETKRMGRPFQPCPHCGRPVVSPIIYFGRQGALLLQGKEGVQVMEKALRRPSEPLDIDNLPAMSERWYCSNHAPVGSNSLGELDYIFDSIPIRIFAHLTFLIIIPIGIAIISLVVVLTKKIKNVPFFIIFLEERILPIIIFSFGIWMLVWFVLVLIPPYFYF